jgi:hypothetical protein
MPRHVITLIGVGVLMGSTVRTADFWIEKPFLEWSNGDVEKMTTASPWAATVTVALPPGKPTPTADASGRGGRGGGDEGFGPLPTRIRVTISWRSALPVKQAVVRAQVGQRGAPNDTHKTFLSQPGPYYVVGLSGLPPQYLRGDITVNAVLRRRNKADIAANQAAPPQPGNTTLLLIGFPRGDISASDEEVEFVAKVATLEFKRKFNLAEMTFGGKLEL